jgi:hypothetical protein
MTDARCTHSMGVQTNLFGRITKRELRASRQIERKMNAMMKMKEDERKKELREERARKLRALIHNPTCGLLRYRVPHSATTDMMNEDLGVEVKDHHQVDGMENNINGTLYSHDNGKPGEKFISLGRVQSQRDGSNARKIELWTMEKYYHIAKPIHEREYPAVKPKTEAAA